MHQFTVPQFIDTEDKIIGPITTRQFVIITVGGLLIFLEYKTADFTLFLLEGIISAVIISAFAFLKVNGMPFHYFLLNLMQTLVRPKTRVWRKEVTDAELQAAIHAPVIVSRGVAQTAAHPPVSKSRLQQLSLEVDTGGAYKVEEDIEKKI
ncbi:MAG: PrgI family protein [Patescibacteria group bacterium]